MNEAKFTVRDLPDNERPRERLWKYGPTVLSAQELVAIVLGSGSQKQSVISLAHAILKRYGSLAKMAEASVEDLCSLGGIGLAKACLLKACFEIGRRCSDDAAFLRARRKGKDRKVTTAKDVYLLVRSRMVDCAKEHFVVLSFDNRNKLLGIDTISVGTLNASLVHPREVFDAAISRHAAFIIAVHNHPSGEVEPSKEDISITKRLVEAGKIMGIEMIDHVIVAKGMYLSLKEKGLV